MAKAATYAGGNIANSVKGGIPIPSTGTGTSGGSASPDVPAYQIPMGVYVEAPEVPGKFTAETNYIGVNGNMKNNRNVLCEGTIAGAGGTSSDVAPQPDWIAPTDDNDVFGGTAQWVRAAGTIAYGGTCTVTAGAATAGAGTYLCNVIGGVVVGDFFWAVVAAGG